VSGAKVGAAGPREEELRSDARVEIERRDSGGLEIRLTSKVELLYGEAIRRQIEETLTVLGVPHGVVTVRDGGAPPFVLDARLEAAARDLGIDVGEGRPSERLPANAGPSPRDRFRRSRLYLPGSQPKFMVNAGLYGADGVILDLEDSVAPPEKSAARVLVRNALRFLDWGGAERMVRINQLPAGLDDLPFVVGHGAQLLLIPKVETPDEVVAVAEAVARLAGNDDPPWLMPILESGKGMLAAEAVASAHPTVVALTLGLEDYTADIGAARTAEGRESFWARSVVVAAAASARVQAIDSVHSDVADEEGLVAACREARSLGFVGKGCIHPRQIPVVHREMAPTDDEIERATRIVRAFDDATARGLGVVSLGSKMVDPPVVARATRTVDLAVRAGRLAPDWKEREKETSDA
jgi:citrate lyase subunit beta/citryl-CoA lyase